MEAEIATKILAARALKSYFAALRRTDGTPADIHESTQAATFLRDSLDELDWCPARTRAALYHDLIEGRPNDVFEQRHPDASFELLVSIARGRGFYELSPFLLGFARGAAKNLESFSLREALEVIREVTRVCRERYAPHHEVPREPPERLAPPLWVDEAAKVALRYLVWVREHVGVEEIERIVARAPDVPQDRKNALLHSLAKQRDVHDAGDRPWTQAFRSNAETALVATLEEYAADGLTFEDVIAEKAEPLAKNLGVNPGIAFGFLYYLALERRP